MYDFNVKITFVLDVIFLFIERRFMSLSKRMYQAKKVSGRVYVCSLNRKEVYVHIEVHVPSQEGERLCACVLGESILPLFLRISGFIFKLF